MIHARAICICGILLCLRVVTCSASDSWARFVGTDLVETARGFTKTKDGGFIVAGATHKSDDTSSDPVLIKFDSSGNVKWKKTFPVESLIEEARSIDQSPDGALIVTTQRSVIKLSSHGAVEWSRRFEKATPLRARASSDHGFLTVGYRNGRPWAAKVDSSGKTQWEYVYSCGIADQIASYGTEVSDGSFLLAALTYCRAPFVGVQLLKVNRAGKVVWNKIFSNPDSAAFEFHYFLGLSETPDGGYIVALNDKGKLKIMKLDSQGSITWIRLYDLAVSDSDTPTTIEQTSEGGYIYVYANHLLKLNQIGEVEWHKIYRHRRQTRFVGLSRENDGSYVLAGTTKKQGSLYDFLLLKVDGNGDSPLSCFAIRDGSSISTIGAIQVFDNTKLNVHEVTGLSTNQVVHREDFASTEDTCTAGVTD